MDALKTILYFSIFRYPLKIEEINNYTNHIELSETQNEINQLLEKKVIANIDGFYVYSNDIQSVTKRKEGNIQAEKAMKIAKKKAKFIAKFPYVIGVGISGSLSKGYYDKDSDIDFFVITKPEKLWICRTLLMSYKKIFLLNSRKYFCINYFISENQLEIEEKNRFTATELKTLIPLQGKAVFEEFYKSNQWVKGFFSNFEPKTNTISETRKPYSTKSVEILLNSKMGKKIDVFFKYTTLKKWNSKFHYLNQIDFEVAFKSTKNISKHHPSHFQKKVITALNEKLNEVQEKFNIYVAKEHV